MSYAESLHAAQLAGLNAAYAQSLIPREDENRREEEPEPPPDGAADFPRRRIRCAHTFDLTRPGCRACSGRPGTPCGGYTPTEVMI